MSVDTVTPSENSDPCPNTPLSPRIGHFEADSDIYSAYNLDQVQFQAIELIIQGFTNTHIANTLGINPKTLWRWKRLDEDFRAALADARSQVFSTVADQYRTLLSQSMIVLAECLEDQARNNRFRAAYALLIMAGRFKPMPASPTPQPAPQPWPEPVLPYKMG